MSGAKPMAALGLGIYAPVLTALLVPSINATAISTGLSSEDI